MKREMLSKLVLVREFELACERWWKAGEPLVGEFHLSLGQEGFAVAACMAAKPTDPICPSIRGMGVYLCRDVPMVPLMASFFEREGGISGGRWAHWHTGVEKSNLLPQTGMLGSGLVTAIGVAMAQKLRKSSNVVIGMVGDGTTNTGYFHEGLNLAAVQRLPIVVVIENNEYAISTPIRSMALVENLSERAAAYGIPGITADGTDVVASYLAVKEGVERARRGDGPTLVELKAYRWGGQTLKDADRVRPAGEKAAARKRCPVETLRTALVADGTIRPSDFDAIVEDVRARIAKAEATTRSLPPISAPSRHDIAREFDPYAA
jgi:pyruvate dehydrogenase E1 component alpha subunit